MKGTAAASIRARLKNRSDAAGQARWRAFENKNKLDAIAHACYFPWCDYDGSRRGEAA